MKQIKLTRDTVANGQWHPAGSVLECDPVDALRLVGYRKAVYCDKTAVQTRDPVVDNRDPEIDAAPAKPKRTKKKGK